MRWAEGVATSLGWGVEGAGWGRVGVEFKENRGGPHACGCGSFVVPLLSHYARPFFTPTPPLLP